MQPGSIILHFSLNHSLNSSFILFISSHYSPPLLSNIFNCSVQLYFSVCCTKVLLLFFSLLQSYLWLERKNMASHWGSWKVCKKLEPQSSHVPFFFNWGYSYSKSELLPPCGKVIYLFSRTSELVESVILVFTTLQLFVLYNEPKVFMK